MDEICIICFEQRCEFFQLHCCKDKRLCTTCLRKLCSPLCPYCRHPIDGLIVDKPTSQPVHDDVFPREYTMIEDDSFYESRILRRSARRMYKLLLREIDAHQNRTRHRSMSI